ncbi:MAG: NAD(P)-dependent oxidoreductase [Bacteroidota bacterium]
MKILIVGSTGGTGRELVKQALELGHDVTAFARNPAKLNIQHERLRIAQGDVLDSASVDRAVQGQDAVLSALGHKRWVIKTTILSEGTKNVIAAMSKHGVRRIVCETTLGISDRRGRMGLYYTLFVVPVLLYFYFRDKELQERLIKESPLDWVIVRPGALTNGRRRGVYRHGLDLGNWFTTVRVSRPDTADFMLKQLTGTTYLRKTPAIAY